MKKILVTCLLFLILLIPNEVYALNEVNIYFFHSNSCNICEQERVFLKALQQDRYPNIRIFDYEISDPDYYNLMQEAKKMFNEQGTGVPFTVVADTPYYGFNQGIKGSFQRTIYKASMNKYENKFGQKIGETYRTDLQGTVQEYKDNANYTIEETSGKVHEQSKTPKEQTSLYKKYKNSIILIGAGILLLIIFVIISVNDYRKGRDS